MPTPDLRASLDADTLWDAGLRNLTAAQVSDILIDIYQTLSARVGKALTSRLNSVDLNRLEQLADNPHAMEAWLTANYPNYQGMVHAENALISRTLKDVADSLRDRASRSATDHLDESD